MNGVYLRKYGVQATINFELFEVDGVDFRTDAAHAAGDTKIMKDEGAEANTANAFVDEGQGYSIVLSAAEMQAARIVIYVVDTATKVWLDRTILIETYGNASAQHAFDLDTANVTVGTNNDKTGYALSVTPPTAVQNRQEMDSNSTQLAKIGTIPALDGAGQTIGAAIAKLADDNGGADFDATNDSLERLANTVPLGTAMRGTDSAALASVCTEARLAELDAGNLPTDIAAIPTTAMRGTDNAATAASLSTHDGKLDAVDVIADAIKAVTDLLPDAGALNDLATILTRLPAALISGRMSSDARAVYGSTDAALKLKTSAETIVIGAAAAGTLSTTQMTTDLTEVTDDHYNGRIIIWTSGVLINQATDITDYDGGTKMFTYTAVTEAPSAADTFVIV